MIASSAEPFRNLKYSGNSSLLPHLPLSGYLNESKIYLSNLHFVRAKLLLMTAVSALLQV